MASTIEQFTKKLKSLPKCVNRNRVSIPALKLVEGLMKRRIFNDGLASDNTSIGQYVSNWKNVREKNNRQNSYVDLSFEGNLLKSVQVGTSDGDNVLGFSTTKQRLIAENNENFRKKKIFALSDSERSAMNKSIARSISKELKKCFKQA